MLKPFYGDTTWCPAFVRSQVLVIRPTHDLCGRAEIKTVLWGDVVHVAAVQSRASPVTIGYDVDAPAKHDHQFAAEQRARYLIGGAHFVPGLARMSWRARMLSADQLHVFEVERELARL